MLKKITIISALLLLNTRAYATDEITVNGLFKDQAIVSIANKQRLLKKGKPSPEGILLIEANSKEAIIEINGNQKTYTLGVHINNEFTDSTIGKKIILAADASGMYKTSGSINGFNVQFIVDTGATLVSMNSSTAKRIGTDYKLEGQESFAYTASGKEKVYLVNLKKVRIGDIELRNIPAAVHDGDFPISTLLGMSFLSKLDMKREGRIMELQKKY